MAVIFGAYECLDPRVLAEECYRHNLPVEPWLGKANSFACPLGPTPGQGILLLLRATLDTLNLNANHDLVFWDGIRPKVTLKNLVPVRAMCCTPGARGDRLAAYMLEITDKRWLASAYPIDAAYNVRSEAGGSSYFSATKNGGSAWTWAEMVQDIWETITPLGAWPGLPFTPHGTPEGFSFYGANAYDALNTVLDRLGCALYLDPLTDRFTIKQLGEADATATDTLIQWDDLRIWDDEPIEPNRGRVPHKVRVHFVKQDDTADTTGASHYYTLDRTDPTASGVLSGVESGTYALLYDDLPAVYAAGVLSNGSTLSDRADERAEDFFRQARQERIGRTYTGQAAPAGLLPGKQIRAIEWRDLGAGLVTRVESGPGLWPADGSLGGSISNPQGFYTSITNVMNTSIIRNGGGGGGGGGSGGGSSGSGSNWYNGGAGFWSWNINPAILVPLIRNLLVGFGGGGTSKYESYFRDVGTGTYYLAGHVPQLATTAGYNADEVFALPFLATRGGTINLAINVSTAGAGGLARVGLYTNTSDTILFPDSLIAQTELDVSTTGIKAALTGQALSANTLYWAAFVHNNNLSPQYESVNSAECWPILGTGPFFTAGSGARLIGWYDTYAYAALPNTFPGTATVLSSSIGYLPGLGFKFTA
jgi:hypothetical protein